jgi:hypothetical protein
MSPFRVALAARLAVVLVVAVACGTDPDDPYPFHGETGAGVTVPRAIGQPTSTLVVFFSPREGDTIELLGAEPIGLPPSVDARFDFSPPVQRPDGSWVSGERLEPLEGAVVVSRASVPEGNGGGIVATLTAHEVGRFTLSAIRLRYRINDGPEQVREGIDATFIICVADPAPETCEPPG